MSETFLALLRDSWTTVRLLLPQIAGALLLLAAGWLVGRLLQRWTHRVADRSLQRLSGAAAVGDAVDEGGLAGFAPILIGRLVFWLVIIAFATVAVEVVGLRITTDLLGRFLVFLPNLIGAAIIIIAGIVGARILRSVVATAAQGAGLAQWRLIAGATYAAILIMASVIALEQLGVNGRLLEIALAVIVGSTFAAAALAFGLGARTVTANLIAARYVASLLQVGQEIRIDDVRGAVVELTPTLVVIETADGRATVPASRFHEATTGLPNRVD